MNTHCELGTNSLCFLGSFQPNRQVISPTKFLGNSFAATCVDLEIIILSNQIEKDKCCISLMRGILKNLDAHAHTHSQTHFQNRLTDIVNKL